MKKYLWRLWYWVLWLLGFLKNQDTGQSFQEDIRCGYLWSNAYPRECRYCSGKKFKEENFDTLDGHVVLEFDVMCDCCGKRAGHWAYGNYTL